MRVHAAVVLRELRASIRAERLGQYLSALPPQPQVRISQSYGLADTGAARRPHRVVATAPEIPHSFTFAFSVDTWSLLSQVTTKKASVALWGGAVGLA